MNRNDSDPVNTISVVVITGNVSSISDVCPCSWLCGIRRGVSLFVCGIIFGCSTVLFVCARVVGNIVRFNIIVSSRIIFFIFLFFILDLEECWV